MSIIDKILSVIAPHDCINCGKEGLIICDKCLGKIPAIQPRCFKCLQPSADWITCLNCRPFFPINRLIIAKEYTLKSKAIVWKLKNDGVQEAARIMAREMAKILPKSPEFNKLLIVPSPTSHRRSRQRGYDQAKLIAKELQKLTNLSYANPLRRKDDIHQVGANIKTRKEQLQDSFEVIRHIQVKNQHILLVDDVVTTGSTLESAARTLINAGASEVWAICFAHPRLRKIQTEA